MMGARGGDIASIDIIVPAKNTGIAPGPMLTEFKEAGIGYYSHAIVKKSIENQIQFTDLKTILFYLGFTEKNCLHSLRKKPALSQPKNS